MKWFFVGVFIFGVMGCRGEQRCEELIHEGDCELVSGVDNTREIFEASINDTIYVELYEIFGNTGYDLNMYKAEEGFYCEIGDTCPQGSMECDETSPGEGYMVSINSNGTYRVEAQRSDTYGYYVKFHWKITRIYWE